MFLKEISDDYLICLCRENNEDAKNELCERYSTFIYGILNGVQKKYGNYIDFEEYFQESFLSFLKCIERYDNESGCFYYFVKTTIEKRLEYKIRKNNYYMNYIPLDKFIYEDGEETLMDYISEDGENNCWDSIVYNEMIDRLDELSCEIVELRIKGYSYGDIAKLLGINKQNVYRQVIKIKNIIKDVIEKID